MSPRHHFLIFAALFLVGQSTLADELPTAKPELDAFWAEVSRSVGAGDFAGYAATCHPQGVLVSQKKQASYPLDKALAGWKQGFLDTKAGKMKAGVDFRFSKRLGDETTAHETGIFRYFTIDDSGQETAALIHFTALLIKSDGRWRVLMEHQKHEATEREWNALKSVASSKAN